MNMKLTSSLFALVSLIAVPTSAQPAYVQSGYGECYPSTTCTVTFGVPGVPGVPVTAGSLLVATVRTDNNGEAGTVQSVTSQPGNRTWTRDRRQVSPTDFFLEVWSLPNAPGGVTTVTVTQGGPADQQRIVLTEYSGVATSNHVDATTSGAATGATANAGNITTPGTDRLIHVAVAADGNDDADSFTPGPGYTIHDLGPDPYGSDKTMTQHRVAAIAGAYGTTMGNIHDSWAAVAVAYKPSGSGGSVPAPAAPTNVRIVK